LVLTFATLGALSTALIHPFVRPNMTIKYKSQCSEVGTSDDIPVLYCAHLTLVLLVLATAVAAVELYVIAAAS
jgi:hypothetical protein